MADEGIRNGENEPGIGGFTPLGIAEVGEIIRSQYQENLKAGDEAYTVDRGVRELLEENPLGQPNDYAKLPGVGGVSAWEVIRRLPPQSEVLDVGCGDGKFVAEMRGKVNTQIQVTGYDARRWGNSQEGVDIRLGDIDRLSFGELGRGEGFRLVTSAALVYHLADPWGAVLRLANVVDHDGVILVSGMPRVVYEKNGQSAEGKKGDMIRKSEVNTPLYVG